MLSLKVHDRRLAVVAVALERADGKGFRGVVEGLRVFLRGRGWPAVTAWLLLAHEEVLRDYVDFVKHGARPDPRTLEEARRAYEEALRASR